MMVETCETLTHCIQTILCPVEILFPNRPCCYDTIHTLPLGRAQVEMLHDTPFTKKFARKFLKRVEPLEKAAYREKHRISSYMGGAIGADDEDNGESYAAHRSKIFAFLEEVYSLSTIHPEEHDPYLVRLTTEKAIDDALAGH